MFEDGVVAQCGMRCRFDIPATFEHPPRVIPPKEQLQIEGQAPAVMDQTILALYMSHFVMLSVRMHSSHPAPSDFVALPLDCAPSTSACDRLERAPQVYRYKLPPPLFVGSGTFPFTNISHSRFKALRPTQLYTKSKDLVLSSDNTVSKYSYFEAN